LIFRRIHIILYILTLLFTICASIASAQQPPNQPNKNIIDSTQFKKSNTADWKDESYRTTYLKLSSDKINIHDSSIHIFHRRLVNLPYRDLGNSGSALVNLQFKPDHQLGPNLGYHAFDVYRYNIDSINYYNTNRPYTSFGYQLGGKQEQLASIMHSQNIKPNWNFAIGYRKINSPGYYNIQRTNHDNVFLSTHYQSRNLRYELYGGVIYNKEQQDENGGIVNDTFLTNKLYSDRRTIKVAFQNDAFGGGASVKRSPVSNMQRDYSILLQHSYSWGKRDTVYSNDSQHYHLEMTPRFSITHRIEVGGQRLMYKDLSPDSLRYTAFFQHSFKPKDSVYSKQDWFYTDNRLLLNGYAGKRNNALHVSAGLGFRSDMFSSYILYGPQTDRTTSTYVIATLKKEALTAGKWFYQAHVMSYLLGIYSGNTGFNFDIGKDIGKNWGVIAAGASQQINSPSYNYSKYYNQYDTILYSFNKESVTQFHLGWLNEKRNLNIQYRNYLLGNYIYLNANQLPAQNATTFNVSQFILRKAFTWKILVLDNELMYQKASAAATINVPELIGRHQLAIETHLFHKALTIATGFELRYQSAYSPAAYSPFFNRFYYQTAYFPVNQPEESFFFNFRVKRFRCYLMLDQLQQLFTRNTIIAQGYAAQNFQFRFGFNWVMIN